MGVIFNIQRYCVDDGPGIRTTVFFKGCNLKCAWCHNPESQSFNIQRMFYKDKCTGCGKCVKVCPYNLNNCDFCGECGIYCPNDARKICGKEYSADEVFNEIIKDKVFYENSGGGVTFSGGECMLQIDFLLEILKKCKENGIHTAIDTAGHIPWESFERVMPYTDLFLYDIKAMDCDIHKKYTGVENTLIIENLSRLLKSGAYVWVRIPVIPSVNSNEKEMKAIRCFFERNGYPSKIELLPYHSMGEHKYDALGRKAEKFEVPSKEDIEKFEKIVSKGL